MFRFINLIFVLILGLAGIGVILFQILRFLGMTRWSSARREKERKESIATATSLLDNPVPWRIEEFDLISQSYECSRRASMFKTEYEGNLSTIYGEDFMGFHLKRFSESDYILSLATDNLKITVVNSGNSGKIWVQDELVGHISKGRIVDKDNKLIGSVEIGPTYNSLIIKKKDVAHTQKRNEDPEMNTRLFELVHENKIEQEDVWPMTVLTAFEILSDDLL